MEHFTTTLGNIFIKYMNFKRKPMIPLSGDEKTQYDDAKVCYLCKEEFCIDKKVKITKIIRKLGTTGHFKSKHLAAAHTICNLK